MGTKQIAHRVLQRDKKWSAKTRFTIDSKSAYVLELETHNRLSDLITTALIYRRDSESLTHSLGIDYLQIVLRSKPRRVAENNIRAQHDEALSIIDIIAESALNHYSD